MINIKSEIRENFKKLTQNSIFNLSADGLEPGSKLKT